MCDLSEYYAAHSCPTGEGTFAILAAIAGAILGGLLLMALMKHVWLLIIIGLVLGGIVVIVRR